MTSHAAYRFDDAPRRMLSVADLSRMVESGIIGDDENVELIEGELYVMAAKKFAHEFIKASLVRLFVECSSKDIFVGIEASLRLDAHTLVEPDILVCRRDRIVVSPEGYIATPPGDILLLVEVADSTLRKDRNLKGKLYGRFGLPEYWIVDTRRRVTWRHRDARSGGFAAIDKVLKDEPVTPDASDLARIVVRLSDFE